MKKLLSVLLLLTAVLFSSNIACAKPPLPNDRARQNFEQRLQLTKKQKEKAKVIHQQGMEQMKPVIMQLELARNDLEALKKSNLSQNIKEQQIAKKEIEIRSYERRANEIRRKNSREFEQILTKKQKKELDIMKAEGRARFNRQHPPRPPFGGFGAGGFFSPHRLFPPMPPMD